MNKFSVVYWCKYHHETRLDYALGEALTGHVPCSTPGCMYIAKPQWMEAAEGVSENEAALPQPAPLPGSELVLSRVIQDLKDRAESGRVKYGTYLYTFNGRKSHVDLYQELLDAVMYAGQLCIEVEKMYQELKELRGRLHED